MNPKMEAALLCIALLVVTSYFVQAQVGLDDKLKNELVSTIVTKIDGSDQEGSFELLGHNCQYSVKPEMKKFKLKNEGKVWCPGWTTLTGKSLTNSRSGAVELAVREFVNEASDAGLIPADQAREYIEKFKA